MDVNAVNELWEMLGSKRHRKRGKIRKLREGTATTCERVGSWQNDAMVRDFTNVGIIWIIFFLQSGIY